MVSKSEGSVDIFRRRNVGARILGASAAHAVPQLFPVFNRSDFFIDRRSRGRIQPSTPVTIGHRSVQLFLAAAEGYGESVPDGNPRPGNIDRATLRPSLSIERRARTNERDGPTDRIDRSQTRGILPRIVRALVF